MYQAIVLLLLFIINFPALALETFLLSGQIKASDNQSFFSPKSDSWQVQVQWILPEGDIAQKLFFEGLIYYQYIHDYIFLEDF